LKNSGRNISLTSYDDLFSTEETRRGESHEQIQRIPLSELHPFKDHPFRVVDDDRMMETVESVKEYGVLVPAIARPLEDGGYEIIAGHRRKRACELAGMDEMPVIVKNLDDDESVIIMVDSNLQRENILPSERAKAYQMKLEAIKRKAGRPSRENSSQVATNFRADEVVGAEAGMSKDSVRRFIRLNNLELPLRDKVDSGELAFTPAVELSYLKPEEQQWLQTALEVTQQTPSLSQAQRIKKESKEGTLSEQGMIKIMSEEKKPLYDSVTLSHDTLKKYFPKSYTAKQMEKVIIKLLDNWLRNRQRVQER
jgi:ParB family chromosome partitioning protein